ncbi:MAG TPA: phosphoribosyltransferase [Candidatus Rubrimentiphilum sp.]|nr:phosphoribosyltransferase [Candidatus Rubrimentiphilum sp.]
MLFRDRADAGRRLAEKLSAYAGGNTRVLALPRGGVPVAFEVARSLNAPLDVFVVRKLGVPGHEELAMGAIASGGVRVLNEDTIAQLRISQETVDAVTKSELGELNRREAVYRDGLPAHDVAGKPVILIDDGLATGASMYAAVLALRARSPSRTIVAVPVAPLETCEAIARHVDEMVCAETPEPFRGVGAWYHDFRQVDDEEVRLMLRRARPVTDRDGN